MSIKFIIFLCIIVAASFYFFKSYYSKKTINNYYEKFKNNDSPTKSTKSVTFNEVVQSCDIPKEFIPSDRFIGAKSGYVFKMDTKGLGYYLDNL